MGRRSMLGLVAVALLGVGGWSVWRWRQKRAALLSGPWRARIGTRGALTSREGELMIVTLTQEGENLRLASNALDIEHDPEWENYRDFWKQRTGNDLTRVFYRGEGKVLRDEEGLLPGVAPDAEEASSARAPLKKKPARLPPRPVSLRRVIVDVHIATPGSDSETIDEGVFRGIVDTDDQWIHGRLWLRSEQAERVMDLRRSGG